MVDGIGLGLFCKMKQNNMIGKRIPGDIGVFNFMSHPVLDFSRQEAQMIKARGAISPKKIRRRVILINFQVFEFMAD